MLSRLWLSYCALVFFSLDVIVELHATNEKCLRPFSLKSDCEI